MIDVDYIFNRVNDLSVKHNSGYTDSVTFNRDLQHMQEILFRYYVEMYGKNKRIVDAMVPFVKIKDVTIVDDGVTPPSDMEHIIEGSSIVVDVVCDGENIKEEAPIYRLVNDTNMTRSSSIRKPSLEKKLFYYERTGNKLLIYPQGISGRMRLKYFKRPTEANRAVTLDATTDSDIYNPNNSTQLEWNRTETDNVIDILLFFKGLQIRESNLLQWVSAKEQTYPQTT